MPSIRLTGRNAEVSRIDHLVDAARESGQALVITGEPGIGKSALMSLAEARASEMGMLVLKTIGIESEMDLAFAGLQQLVQPILSRSGELPAPQRDALQAALGLIESRAPDLFLIGLAALNLIAATAEERPVLILAEDAHWLDRSTVDVLAFVARRIGSDQIAFIAAIRDGFPTALDSAAIEQLDLDRLDAQSSSALLTLAAPQLGPAVRARVLEQAAGNPLALTELPLALATHPERTAAIYGSLPLTRRVERAFSGRLSELPAPTRALVLVAAVNDSADPNETLAAARVISDRPITLDDLSPAVEAGLIALHDAGLRFRHPLVRSAVRQAAAVSEVQAVHIALASAMADDPDRRTWHLAASTIGSSEEVASELEALAVRAQHRGSSATAAAAFERAAQLSERPTRRAARLLLASERLFEVGQFEETQRLLGQAESLPLAPGHRGQLALMRELCEAARPRSASELEPLVRTAEAMLREGRRRLGLNLLWAAASSCYWTDPGRETRERVVSALDDFGLEADDAWRLIILASAAPIEYCAEVMAQLSNATPGEMHFGAIRQLGNAANCVGAFGIAKPFLETAAQGLRTQGRLGLLSHTLGLHAWALLATGDLVNGIAVADEAVRLARETSPNVLVANALAAWASLSALRGDEEAAEAAAAETEAIALSAGGHAVILSGVQLARGLAALGSGRHTEAYSQLRRIFDPRDPAHSEISCSWAVGNLADAAIHSGHTAEAARIIAEVGRWAPLNPGTWSRVAMRHALALLADDRDAEAAFADALREDLSDWRFERARLQLSYGQWLRRRRRMADSREPLRAAREAFDALGASPWSALARTELRASGETSRRRAPEARDQLTPQETQIAQLASDGLSNAEIGARLFISQHTVAYHMRKVFSKLGISSRHKLARALTEGAITGPIHTPESL